MKNGFSLTWLIYWHLLYYVYIDFKEGTFMWLNKKKKIGLTILFVSGLILLGVILIYAFSNGQSKTPATCQQVTTVLSDLGYVPSDTN